MSADCKRRTAGSVQMFRKTRAMKALGVPAAVALAVAVSGGASLRAEPAMAPKPAEAVRQVAAAPAKPPAMIEVPAQDYLSDPKSLKEERARNKMVGETRVALTRSGAAPLYAPALSAELSLRMAAVGALRKNLDIKRKGLAKAMAEHALIEADAVFDPVLTVSANAALTNQFRRTVTPAMKYKPATQTVPVGQTDSTGVFLCTAAGAPNGLSGAAGLSQGSGNGRECYVTVFPQWGYATATQMNLPRAAGLQPNNDPVYANVSDPQTAGFTPRHDAVLSNSVSLFQQLPWGSSLNLSLSNTYHNTTYMFNVQNGQTPGYNYYNRPHFASASLNASVPLPYTKNFGPTASGDYGQDVARTNIDAAELDIRATINDTLLTVDTLYWQLVGSIGKMEAAGQSLSRAERLRDSTKRLFDQGFVSESDRSQIEAQVASIRARQQQLFGDYVKASEAMRKVLAGTEDALFLPVGYQSLMKRPMLDLTESERILNNPNYQRQAVAVRLATLARERGEAQTRPDLMVSGTVTVSEGGAFGYHDMGGALSNLFAGPDSFAATVSLLYTLPLGNRAALAALDSAEHGFNRQAMALRQIELSTRESFETARAALASAGVQVRNAERTVKVATEVYDSAVAQQELGLVAAYESLSRLGALLDARTALVQAEINRRLAETRLLSAVGALAERYGDLSVQTAIDRNRLALLRESGALKHFGGPL